MTHRSTCRSRSPVAANVMVAVALVAASISAVPTAAKDPAARATSAADAYVRAYRAANIDALLAVYTEDATFIDVSQRKEVTGKDELRQMLATLMVTHSSIDIEVKRQMAKGETTMLEVVYTGTIEPSRMGRTDLEPLDYAIPAVLIFETRKGLIDRQIDYLDFRALSELMALIQPPTEDS